MTKGLYLSLISIGALLFTMSCAHQKDELAHSHSHDHGEVHVHDHEADDHHDHEGEEHHEGEHAHESESPNEITLAPAIAEKFGVVVDTINIGDFNEVIKVTGQIIGNPASSSVVSAPTSGIVRFSAGIQPGKDVSVGTTIATISSSQMSGGDRNAADKAVLDAAKAELDRLTPLYEEGIVSQKDYNAAKQAYEVARSQYSPSAASGVAKAVSTGVITDMLVSNGQYVEAGAPIALVSSNKRLTLRADVPDRYYKSVPTIQNARIRLPYSEEIEDLESLNGVKVSANDPSARTTPGYIPVYFSFDNNGMTVPNTFVDVYLIGAPRSNVLSVPVGAIIEQQGNHFVFVQLDDECYEKIPVKVGASDGNRTMILSGLEGGERVVVEGAWAVKLAETSAVAPEGHSHNH